MERRDFQNWNENKICNVVFKVFIRVLFSILVSIAYGSKGVCLFHNIIIGLYCNLDFLPIKRTFSHQSTLYTVILHICLDICSIMIIMFYLLQRSSFVLSLHRILQVCVCVCVNMLRLSVGVHHFISNASE